MRNGTRMALMFASGVLFAAAVNNARWAIWPLSGGPYFYMNRNGDGPQIFGWLGGPPGYGRPIAPRPGTVA